MSSGPPAAGPSTTFETLEAGRRSRFAARPGPVTRAGLIGLGVIGAVHLDVLQRFPDVAVDFVVDPRPGPDAGHPGVHRARTLRAALERVPPPDLVVVATPTDTHLELVAEVLDQTAALVLSEKPLTRSAAQLRGFEAEHADDIARLRVVNHFAFSPEVRWAVRLVEARGWGPPQRVVAAFDDPYVLKSADQRASYVSPWVDSGSNQVSLLSRLCRGWVVRSQQVEPGGLRAVTELDFDGGSATLLANWSTGDSSKQTTLHWPGRVEVHLDHTSMTGYAVVDGAVVHHVGHDGRTGRKAAHYTAMYDALLAGTDQDLLGVDLARTVADVLEAGAVAGSRTGRTAAGGRGLQ